MGPPGYGKSTLLNMVGMIDTPNSGEYFFDAAEIASRSENDLVGLRKQNIGFIFQNFNLIDDLSVQENVDLSLLYLGLGKKERKEKVAQALGLVGLEGRANHQARQQLENRISEPCLFQIETQIEKLEENLQVSQSSFESLLVRAPIAG